MDLIRFLAFMRISITMAIASATFALANQAGALEDNRSSMLDILEQQASRSDLAFHGKVINTLYRVSSRGVVHTFTKFEIQEVLIGRFGADTIIVRTVGGLFYEDGSMKELHVTGIPVFASGDSALIFLTSNGNTECPFYGCESGVYFVVDNNLAHSGFYKRHVAINPPLSPPQPVGGMVKEANSNKRVPVLVSLQDSLDRLRSMSDRSGTGVPAMSLDPEQPFIGLSIQPFKRPDNYPVVPKEMVDLAEKIEGDAP
jgi:hypothetical protein